jgi:hypothetical protein
MSCAADRVLKLDHLKEMVMASFRHMGSIGGGALGAGETRGFFAIGFAFQAAISVSAVAESGLGHSNRILRVEDVRVSSPGEGEINVICTVRNVGPERVPGFLVNFAQITP